MAIRLVVIARLAVGAQTFRRILGLWDSNPFTRYTDVSGRYPFHRVARLSLFLFAVYLISRVLRMVGILPLGDGTQSIVGERSILGVRYLPLMNVITGRITQWSGCLLLMAGYPVGGVSYRSDDQHRSSYISTSGRYNIRAAYRME